ncbi:MAG: hypothetical protein HY075_09190 [Deltaproteobacteria bacterium]|nr:hypothetical protein [Deltaproteobacteria bacterium]
MHFFHVDRQPRDWRVRNEAADTKQGRLVYHILDWAADAKKALKDKNWDGLAERLHGISHYLGDLSQPLHTNHDYDGDEAGLPDIHAQFETKMLNRFEADVRAGVKKRLAAERLPELWDQFDLRHLVFDTAEQSCVKVPKLFAEARHALVMPKRSKHHKYKTEPQPRFEKKILWERTGALAMDQLALGARLWAFALNSICRP